MANNLAIIGAGEQANEIFGLVRLTKKYNRIVLVDLCAGNTSFIISEKEFMTYNKSEWEILIGQGEPRKRKELWEKYSALNFVFASFIHETAVINMNCSVSKGSIVFPHCYLAQNVIIGENVLVHSGTRIENDCCIDKNCFISSGVFIGAKTNLFEESFVGPNASVKDRLRLGEKSVVGIGSNVLNDVDANCVVVGNPARFIRFNEAKDVLQHGERNELNQFEDK